MAINKDKIRVAAQRYLQKGQIDKAIREYQRIAEADPSDVRTLLKIGDLQTRNNDVTSATDTYTHVAEHYSDRGFFLKAVAVYKQVIKLNPDLIEISERLAQLYTALGLVSDAMLQYRQLFELYEQQGRLDDGAALLAKMIEIDPESIATRIKLADLLTLRGRATEAREQLRAVAKQLKEQKRIDDYTRVAEKLVAADPSDMATMHELANIYLQRGEARKALGRLQICFKAAPNDVDTLTLMANAFRDLGQTQKSVSVHKEIARIHASNGNTEAQRAVLLKVLNLKGHDTEAEISLSAIKAKLPRRTHPASTPEGKTSAEVSRIMVGQKAVSVPREVQEVNHAVAHDERRSDAADLGDDLIAVEEELSRPAAATSPTVIPPGVERLLVEADIYIKYGLNKKALEHLADILTQVPNYREAHKRFKDVHRALGDFAAASQTLWLMAQAARAAGNLEAAFDDVDELLSIDPKHAEARALFEELEGTIVRPEPRRAAPDRAETGEDDEHPDELGIEIQTDDLTIETTGEIAPSDSDAILTTSGHGRRLSMSDTQTDLIIIAPTSDESKHDQRAASAARPEDRGDTIVTTLTDLGDLDDIEDEDKDEDKDDADEQASNVNVNVGVDTNVDVNVGVDVDVEDDTGATLGLQQAREEETLQQRFDEIEFYEAQGLLFQAIAALNDLAAEHPGHPRVKQLRSKLGARQQPAESGAAASTVFETDDAFAQTIDLAAELALELEESVDVADPDAGSKEGLSLDEMFDEFKQGVAEQVSDSDFETHYNLGIAYHEMALIDDALREFAMASTWPARAISALTMMGLCEFGRGNTEQALEHFLEGLRSEHVTPNEAVALRYEIGCAYEAQERYAEAIRFFKRAHEIDPGFRDVTERLQAARGYATQREDQEISHELDELLNETDAERNARNKQRVSYV